MRGGRWKKRKTRGDQTNVKEGRWKERKRRRDDQTNDVYHVRPGGGASKRLNEGMSLGKLRPSIILLRQHDPHPHPHHPPPLRHPIDPHPSPYHHSHTPSLSHSHHSPTAAPSPQGPAGYWLLSNTEKKYHVISRRLIGCRRHYFSLPFAHHPFPFILFLPLSSRYP